MIPTKESDLVFGGRGTNGSLKDFNPAELMKKVAETGNSLHTIREYKNKKYYITVYYEELFGGLGIDNPEELYWISIVVEYPDGSQKRVSGNFDMDNLTYDEVVESLNQWKTFVLRRDK